MQLTDSKAARLALLLQLYFEDCVAEDPTTPHPGNLTVRELLEDLETSVSEPEASDIVETALSNILDLFLN